MIDFEGYYSIAEDQVEYVETTKTNSPTFPHQVTVYLLSGRSMSVSYKTEASASAVKRRISTMVDIEKRRKADEVITSLREIKEITKRTDKRQLKIWRQLKELLGVSTEEEE